MRYLVTGGAGFIGANFVRFLFEQVPGVQVCNLDALTYAGNPDNLIDLENHGGYRFVMGNICDVPLVDRLAGEVDGIIHFAAESHVDRSIENAVEFVRTNVEGTQVLLDAARKHRHRRFVHVSTDEVYGSLGQEGRFSEDSPLQPNSPYAASKAAAECLVRAAFHTHQLPAIITRASNNYGPFQFPEKFIPLAVCNLLADQPIPIYGTGANVRNWIHVADHARGIWAALNSGQAGRVYNLGGDDELSNLEVAHLLLRLLGKDDSFLRFVADRPGHDFRYSLDSSRAHQELAWRPAISFAAGLEAAVRWYCDNPQWIERVRSGAFRQYYERRYASVQ